MKEVYMPDLGEDIEEAIISFWHVEEGDVVEEGDSILEVTTDKSNFNVPSPCKGIVIERVGQEGQSVPVGALIAKIEEEEGA